jgi:hypothetical protein
LYRAVELVCMYVRQNCPQEFLGDLRGVSQPTVSRIIATLVPTVTEVLDEFVPGPAQAIEAVQGRVCLVDGTLARCWSYADQRELWSRKYATTGFNTQVIGLLDGRPVFVSDPLPGNTHDARAFVDTPVADIVRASNGGIGDKGYQGCDAMATPRKRPPRGELSQRDKQCNSEHAALRAPIERLIANLKAWRILHTDFRRPRNAYLATFKATRALFFFATNWGYE